MKKISHEPMGFGQDVATISDERGDFALLRGPVPGRYHLLIFAEDNIKFKTCSSLDISAGGYVSNDFGEDRFLDVDAQVTWSDERNCWLLEAVRT